MSNGERTVVREEGKKIKERVLLCLCFV